MANNHNYTQYCRKIRPATSLIYEVGNKVYYKRRQSDKWRGPGSIIGKEKHQVFVKHGEIYVHVNPCHLRHVNENNQLNNLTTVSVGAEDSRTINQKETMLKQGKRRDDWILLTKLVMMMMMMMMM